MYCRAHKTATLTPIQHTVMGHRCLNYDALLHHRRCCYRLKSAAATVVTLLLCQVGKNFTRLQAHTVRPVYSAVRSATIFTRVKWDMEFLTCGYKISFILLKK